MDMTKIRIFTDNIDNKFWLEIIIAIIYVKNNQLTRVLQNLCSYEF